MSNFPDTMSDRFMNLVVNIIELENQLLKTYSGRHIFSQLFRAGTSAGANFEEARAGESRADFIHKMQIVLKGLRESHYWVKLLINANLAPSSIEEIKFLFNESLELTNITAKSVFTAKSNSGKIKA